MNNQAFTNRLINEKSPYLLQHAHNPVDWFPWGEEAFKKAQGEDKPIFLSIGYSTCHWCHVMERESFEDVEVAEALNRDFVSIKVDREERPDIDHVYMSFCQLMSGRGGWPLTVVLSPDRKPFYAATYIPKLPKYGHPGLLQLLAQIKAAWTDQREELLKSGRVIEEALKKAGDAGGGGLIQADIADKTFQDLGKTFDPVFGGFGGAPKFPSPHTILFLLRYYVATGNRRALTMAEKTLDGLYAGGIFDHIGFGFCRYSTDARWLAPHFEKMLYDNALLALAYTEAFAVTGKTRYKEIADKVFTYALRDMQDPLGGFYSAEDADSDGVEGKFYLFKPEEIEKALGKDAALFCRTYDITPKGNFEGSNIPNLIGADLDALEQDAETAKTLDDCREKLLAFRNSRDRPFRDDKILTSWNGLMIAALAFAGRITGNGDYLEAASKAARFIIHSSTDKNRRLLARYRAGEAAIPGYIDDYAFMIWGMIELYEADLDPFWIEKASVWSRDMIRLFWDDEQGGFYIYGNDSEELVLRPKELFDGAMPSGNSAAALVLLRLAALTEDEFLLETAERQFKAFGAQISKAPTAFTHFISGYLSLQTGISSVLIAGSPDDEETRLMLDEMRRHYRPFAVHRFEEGFASDESGTATVAVICHHQSCSAPITESEVLKKTLEINRP